MTIKINSIVKLKSKQVFQDDCSNPEMTVVALTAETSLRGIVRCFWFNEMKDLQDAEFPEECLYIVQE